jgi:uncharacterized membrane protein YfcA
VAVIASGIAAVAGFGIGSILTPTFSIWTGAKLAVAAVSIPHFIGTLQRFWMLRRYVDRRVLAGFGIASALGGLTGALLQTRVSSRVLALVLGLMLVLACVSELTGWMRRVHWGRRAAWSAGALSGVLGGLVGNQGGIRAASMLGFNVPKESFVATATAIALFVDFARLPVYLATQHREIMGIWPTVLAATIGAVLGTAFGGRALMRIPGQAFRRVVALLLAILGIYMIASSSAAPVTPDHVDPPDTSP